MFDGAFETLDRLHLVRARRKGVDVGGGSRFSGAPVISREHGSTIRIGARFMAQSRSRLQVLGVAHACTIRTVHPGAQLLIGDDCGMSGGSIIAATSVRIGDGVLLGADVVIFDTDFHPLAHEARRYAPPPAPRSTDGVAIGSNVFIGTGALVLPGTTIEDDCVVGARSVVRGFVPAGSIVAGSPARVVGSTSRTTDAG